MPIYASQTPFRQMRNARPNVDWASDHRVAIIAPIFWMTSILVLEKVSKPDVFLPSLSITFIFFTKA